MKIFVFLFTLFLCCTVKAQYIFLNDDQYYALVYINAGTKVTVRTEFLGEAYRDVYPTSYQYSFSNNVFYCQSIFSDTTLNYQNTEIVCFPYPEFIPVRNNNFINKAVSSDSIVLDEKNRVKEVHSALVITRSYGHPVKSKTKFTYFADSAIMSINWSETSNSVTASLYSLDGEKNLKTVKTGLIEKNAASGVKLDSINWRDEENFNYNKFRARIERIQTFALDGDKRIPQTTQFFIYKKGRPASSYVRDERTKKVIYRQTYKYLTFPVAQ